MTTQSRRRSPFPGAAAAVSAPGTPTEPTTRPVSAGATLREPIRFVVPGNPVPKGRPRFDTRHGRTYTPPRTAEAEERVRSYMKAAYPHLRPMLVDCGMFVQCFIKGEGRGDWDNFGKLISDALNGVAYEDDSLVQVAEVRLHHHSDKPRTEISIYQLLPNWADVMP